MRSAAPRWTSGDALDGEVLRVLADPVRAAIVAALAVERLCTCHLVEITGAKQTNVSNHLRVLREAEVVGLWLGEVVATLGLVVVVFGTVRSGRESLVAFAVGGYVTAAHWFASSTSFANPAVTLARTLSDTFAGIAPGSVPGFVAAQLLGGALAYALVRLLYPEAAAVADRITAEPVPAQPKPLPTKELP